MRQRFDWGGWLMVLALADQTQRHARRLWRRLREGKVQP